MAELKPPAEKDKGKGASPDPLAHAPALRNAIHAGAFVLFAAPLGALADPRLAIPNGRSIVVVFLLCIALLNLFVMPRLATGKQIRREDDGFINGIVLYPLSLAICFAVFPPFAAIGAWGAMAAGDAAASFFGRMVPWPKLPWNNRKTWMGLLAFALASIPFCFAAMYWCPSMQFLKKDSSPEIPFVWTLSILAALSGAIFESFDGPFDDNLRVPFGVAAILWLSGTFLSFATRGLPKETFVQPENFPRALGVNALLGVAVVLLGFIDIPGVAAGITIGTLIYFFTNWHGYLIFFSFVVCGSLLSKLGVQRKRLRGTEEPRGGKRGVGNVGANLLVPALCCLAFPASRGNAAWLIAYAGAVAAAFADTASSEIGTLSLTPPLLITTLKPVPHGTNGAISVLGSLGAAAACLVVVAVGWLGGFFALVLNNVLHASATSQNLTVLGAVVFIAGLGGTVVDSLLGATIEDRVPGVGKGAVNFACTLTGAGIGGGLLLLVLPILK